MSNLFYDDVVELVELIVEATDGSGSTSYFFSNDHFAAGQLVSGSQFIYPYLIDRVRHDRRVGKFFAEKGNCTFALQAHGKLGDIGGKSVLDLFDENNYSNAEVVIRRYLKPQDALATSVSGGDTRWSGRIESPTLSNDVLTFSCRQLFFPDKEISTTVRKEIHPNLQDKNDGVYGAIVFGTDESDNGLPVRAPILDDGSTMSLFCTWLDTDNFQENWDTIYVRNRTTNVDDQQWLPLNNNTAVPPLENTMIAGDTSTSGLTQTDLKNTWQAILIDTSEDELLTSATAYSRKSGTISSGDGEYRCSIFEVDDAPSTNTVQEKGAPLATATIDPDSLSTTAAFSNFRFNPPVPISKNKKYLATWGFTNPSSSATVYHYFGAIGSGDAAYNKARSSDRDAGWLDTATTTPARIPCAVFGFRAATTEGFSHKILDSVGGNLHNQTQRPGPGMFSYVNLRDSNSTTDYSEDIINAEFKVAIPGILDDDGAYNASSSTVLKNPAAIAHYILDDDEVGVNVGSSRIDDTSFDTARDDLGTAYDTGIVIQSQTFALSFLRSLCEQSRLRIFLDRNGSFSANVAANVTTTTYNLVEAYHRARFKILDIRLTPRSDVINDIQIRYRQNRLQNQVDPDVASITRDQSYHKVAYLNKDDSSTSDTTRESAATTSEALYGRIESVLNADHIHKDSVANNLLNYRFDKFSKVRRLTTFAVKTRDWHESILEIFNTFTLRHSDIYNNDGTFEEMKVHVNEKDSLTYVGGVPAVCYQAGEAKGEIINLVEEGEDIILTLEEVLTIS